MLSAIVRKEFLEQVLTLRFAVGAVFCITLFTASALVLRADYRDRVEAYRAASARHREALASAKVFSEVEIEIDRPPASLSLFCRGEDRALPTSSGYSLIDAPTISGSGARRNPLLAALPGLDLVLVVQVVMSLLALLFAYDGVCGERERGTLALSLSNPAPRSTLLLGKYLGGMAVLLPLLAMGFALSLLVFLTSPLVHFTAQEWVSLVTIFAVSALFLSAAYLAGLVISTRSRHSGTSLVASLFVWVVAVLLLPEVAATAAGVLRPLPSPRQRVLAEERVMGQATRRIYDDAERRPLPLTWEQQERFNVARGSLESGRVPLLSSLYSAPREYVEWAREGTRFGLALRLEAAEEIQHLRWRDTLERAAQAGLARTLRLVSPAAAYSAASTALADTGPSRYLRFLEGVMEARTEFIDFARERDGLDYRFFTRPEALEMPSFAEMAAMEEVGEGDRLRRLLGTGWDDAPSLNLEGLPTFEPAEAGLGTRLAEAAPGLVLLAAVNLLLAFVVMVSFTRADVRPA
jgi:hypothetical protein